METDLKYGEALKKIHKAACIRNLKIRHAEIKKHVLREELMDRINELLPRIEKVCMLVQELDQKKFLKIHEFYPGGKDLFADGVSHNLGCTYTRGETAREFCFYCKYPQHKIALGIEGGGCCHYWVIVIPETKELLVAGNDNEINETLARFIIQFPAYEKEVLNFINSL